MSLFHLLLAMSQSQHDALDETFNNQMVSGPGSYMSLICVADCWLISLLSKPSEAATTLHLDFDLVPLGRAEHSFC